MKLLIDVEEEVYNALKRVGDYLLPTSNNLSGKVYQAVANGTPYNPAGVLTEAEKIICRVYLEDLDKMHTCNEYKLLMSLIDNTQAVDLWQMRQEATENALKKAEVLYGRPKGEWLSQGYGYFCSICHSYHENSNFCPNCGAQMKGGAE